MDIILDSNIFRSDLQLRSSEYEVILDYLKKTDSSIVLPQIILDEIKGLYARTLSERHAKLNSHIQNFNLIVTDSSKHIEKPVIDFDDETQKYEKYLIDKLKVKSSKIIPLNNEHLPDIVKRATSRLKPCGDDGQGFRDSIIWLTLKDYCKKCHEKQVIFISNNDSDFGSGSRNELHPTLKAECDNDSIKVNYFNTIKDFIDNHSTKIDFITYEWLIDKFDDSWLEDIILDELNGKQSSWVVSRYSGKTGNSCTGFFKAKRVYPDSQDDLSIYEMIDNKLIVGVVFGCEVEIEFEIYQEEYSTHYGYSTTITTFDTEQIPCTAYVSITVIDGEIDEVELNDLGY